MEVNAESGSKQLTLTSGNEVALLLFASYMRTDGTRRFDPLGRDRKLKQDLSALSDRLGSVLMDNQEKSIRPDEQPPLVLSLAQSELAANALRWVVVNRDYAPDHATGEMRALVEQIDTTEEVVLS